MAGKSRRIRIAAACLLALVAVSLGGSASAAPGDASQLRKVTIAIIAVDPAAQVMYAKARGFFTRQGIDAEIMVMADGTLTAPAVISGQAQFAAMPTGALAAAKSNGAPFRMVAGGALYEPGVATTVVVAAPRSGIRSARDLVGKRVALDFVPSLAHVGLRRWLERGGVSIEDVDFTTLPFPQIVAPLIRGDVDAAVLPEPYATEALRRGARRVALPMDAVCSQECLLTVYMARRDIDPNLAARFRNAVQQAAVWANQKRNRPASARILAQYAEIPPAARGTMSRSKYATRLRLPLAQPWLDVYRRYGLIPETFRPEDLLK